jgi:hypothetical protein
LGLPSAQTLPSPLPKKGRTNTPWTPAEEQRLKTLRDAGSSWSEIAKTFPLRTEGSVKKHWYKVRVHFPARFASMEDAKDMGVHAFALSHVWNLKVEKDICLHDWFFYQTGHALRRIRGRRGQQLRPPLTPVNEERREIADCRNRALR